MPWEIFSNLFFRTYSIKYVREIPLSTTVLVLKIPLFSFWIFFNKSDFSTIFTLLSCLYHNLYKHECKVCISKNMFLLFLLCLCMRTHLRYESHLESRLSVPNRCLCFQKAQGSEINFLALPLPTSPRNIPHTTGRTCASLLWSRFWVWSLLLPAKDLWKQR